MGEQLILQPNGKLAIYSSVAGGITFYDMSDDEIVRMHVKRAKERAKNDAVGMVERARLHGSSAPAPFKITWEEAVERDEDDAIEPEESGTSCPHCGSRVKSKHRSVMGFGPCAHDWHRSDGT